MDQKVNKQFTALWRKFFPTVEWPIIFFYTDVDGQGSLVDAKSGPHCLIGELARVRAGETIYFSSSSFSCSGGKRYLGYSQKLRPNFEYFLSCSIPGQLEGERYKKTPELVKEHLKLHPALKAPAKYIVFKRWDALTDEDIPQVVIFFAAPDALSGLFTLANFDHPDAHGVIAPFGSGCSSIVYYPLQESLEPHPRAVLGLFDVSARTEVLAQELTFAVPWTKFVAMIGNMEESFLITESWVKVRNRIGLK